MLDIEQGDVKRFTELAVKDMIEGLERAAWEAVQRVADKCVEEYRSAVELYPEGSHDEDCASFCVHVSGFDGNPCKRTVFKVQDLVREFMQMSGDAHDIVRVRNAFSECVDIMDEWLDKSEADNA